MGISSTQAAPSGMFNDKHSRTKRRNTCVIKSEFSGNKEIASCRRTNKRSRRTSAMARRAAHRSIEVELYALAMVVDMLLKNLTVSCWHPRPPPPTLVQLLVTSLLLRAITPATTSHSIRYCRHTGGNGTRLSQEKDRPTRLHTPTSAPQNL